ncbi:MAG: phytanoyl-CoA dioxygenase family protein [Magnetospirillum sp.]|nr:phytanoyl-CoA dioxygenase family protein [Magnetospirillum sp.]
MLETDTRCFVHHMTGLLDAAVLTDLHRHFQAVEAERQGHIVHEHETVRVRIGASTDAFRQDPRWYDPWRRISAATIDRMRPSTWLLYPVMVRHITQSSHLVPWHQDIAYVRRMPRVHQRLITCFVPIEPDPARAASLEFATGAFDELQHGDHGDHGPGLDATFPDRSRFDLSLGDALIFGDHTPHRTIAAPDGSIDRRSFEYRAVIPAEALEDKDYFDIERGCMVRRSAGQIIEVAEPGCARP